MTLGDLVPWGRKDRGLALRDETPFAGTRDVSPFLRLHHEMNRLFDDVFRSFEAPMLGRRWPTLEVQETDDAWRVTAELPGVEDKDVEVSFEDGLLTIRGERRSETQDERRTRTERYYGRFERSIALADVDEDKANARFDKGVLTVTLPKSTQASERVKRIPINAETRH